MAIVSNINFQLRYAGPQALDAKSISNQANFSDIDNNERYAGLVVYNRATTPAGLYVYNGTDFEPVQHGTNTSIPYISTDEQLADLTRRAVENQTFAWITESVVRIPSVGGSEAINYVEGLHLYTVPPGAGDTPDWYSYLDELQIEIDDRIQFVDNELSRIDALEGFLGTIQESVPGEQDAAVQGAFIRRADTDDASTYYLQITFAGDEANNVAAALHAQTGTYYFVTNDNTGRDRVIQAEPNRGALRNNRIIEIPIGTYTAVDGPLVENNGIRIIGPALPDLPVGASTDLTIPQPFGGIFSSNHFEELITQDFFRAQAPDTLGDQEVRTINEINGDVHWDRGILTVGVEDGEEFELIGNVTVPDGSTGPYRVETLQAGSNISFDWDNNLLRIDGAVGPDDIPEPNPSLFLRDLLDVGKLDAGTGTTVWASVIRDYDNPDGTAGVYSFTALDTETTFSYSRWSQSDIDVVRGNQAGINLALVPRTEDDNAPLIIRIIRAENIVDPTVTNPIPNGMGDLVLMVLDSGGRDLSTFTLPASNIALSASFRPSDRTLWDVHLATVTLNANNGDVLTFEDGSWIARETGQPDSPVTTEELQTLNSSLVRQNGFFLTRPRVVIDNELPWLAIQNSDGNYEASEARAFNATLGVDWRDFFESNAQRHVYWTGDANAGFYNLTDMSALPPDGEISTSPLVGGLSPLPYQIFYGRLSLETIDTYYLFDEDSDVSNPRWYWNPDGSPVLAPNPALLLSSYQQNQYT